MRKRRAGLFSIAFVSLMVAGCTIPFFTYPYFWNYTKTKPDESAIVGTYALLRVNPVDLGRAVQAHEPSITLSADDSAVLTNFPQFDGFGETLVCRISGPVTWKLSNDNGSGWNIAFTRERRTRDAAKPECREGISFVNMLGRRAPYRLYLTTGAPDSHTGIEFEKSRHENQA